MKKRERIILFTGTIGPICFYLSGGRLLGRAVSSLTGKRVMKDPKFRRTMENAGVLGRASRIGSFVYGELPKTFRQFWMYRAFTGEAIQLLREGKTDEEAKHILWKTYAEVWVNRRDKACSKDKACLVFTHTGNGTATVSRMRSIIIYPVISAGVERDQKKTGIKRYLLPATCLPANKGRKSGKKIRNSFKIPRLPAFQATIL